jgi:hypothetical protein
VESSNEAVVAVALREGRRVTLLFDQPTHLQSLSVSGLGEQPSLRRVHMLRVP